MVTLRGKQKTYLRGLGSQIKATVFIGKEGISAAVVQSVNNAFANSELIKLKVERGCPLDRRDVGHGIAASTQSELVQVLGRTLLLYRPSDEPQIELPQ